MLKIHTSDGITTRLDLNDEMQAKEWLNKLKNLSFQEQITGISILQNCNGPYRCPVCKSKVKPSCPTCGQSTKNIRCNTGVQYSVSKPKGFHRCFYQVEHLDFDPSEGLRGGERIICFADDVRISLMVHASAPSTRVNLVKTGRQRYNPFMDRG